MIRSSSTTHFSRSSLGTASRRFLTLFNPSTENRSSRPHNMQWHSARRLNLAEVLRRGFVVSLSDMDAAQEQEQEDTQ